MSLTQTVVVLTVILSSSFALADSSGFPNRKYFPSVPYIEIDELHKIYDDAIIVDVRSSYEYGTLRIKGAVNHNVHNPGFIAAIRQLREENKFKPIIMYCNGRTCKKSYEAVQICLLDNINNLRAFDAGIYDWAEKYPQYAELLGKPLVNAKKLISKERLTKHTVEVAKFKKMIRGKNVMVLDVRDRVQREASSLFPYIDRHAYLENQRVLNRYIQQAKQEGKTLLIYDAVGKQVEWLMYHLEDQGVKNYYFMQGGAEAYYTSLRQELAR